MVQFVEIVLIIDMTLLVKEKCFFDLLVRKITRE